jgi:epoxyqueuosine reductase QueG
MEKSNYGMLNILAAGLGMGSFRVCALENEAERFHRDIRERARNLSYAVCMGIPLSREIFDTITDGPNDIYKTHYRQANALLDTASFMIAKHIEAKGYKALPIPASFTVDEKMQTGHLSHKWLAEKAGLGWRGRNNLLVTEKFGSAIRLTTVLTDMPLMTNIPVEFGCGDCYDCIDECPAEALGEKSSEYNFDRCYSQILKYSRRDNFGLMICGHCIKACRPK